MSDISLTLILTAVAFRFAIGDKLPVYPYTTVMDKDINANLAFLFLVSRVGGGGEGGGGWCGGRGGRGGGGGGAGVRCEASGAVWGGGTVGTGGAVWEEIGWVAQGSGGHPPRPPTAVCCREHLRDSHIRAAMGVRRRSLRLVGAVQPVLWSARGYVPTGSGRIAECAGPWLAATPSTATRQQASSPAGSAELASPLAEDVAHAGSSCLCSWANASARVTNNAHSRSAHKKLGTGAKHRQSCATDRYITTPSPPATPLTHSNPASARATSA